MYDYGSKTANTAPAVGGIHYAKEFNNSHSELKNAVTTSGQSLTSPGSPPGTSTDSNTTQLAEAMARYASGGVIAACSGTENAKVLVATNTFIVPKALFDGMIVITTVNSTNTGATTANVFGLGSKKVLSYTGAALIGGELVANQQTAWQYSTAADGAAGAWLILPWADLSSGASSPITNTIINYKPASFILQDSGSTSCADGATTKLSHATVVGASFLRGASTLTSSRFTVQGADAGWWLFVGYAAVILLTGPSGGDDLRLSFGLNGTTGPFSSLEISGSGTYGMVVTEAFKLTAGQYVEMFLFHNTGAARDVGSVKFFGIRLGAG